tara:strand:+ start:656 stop:946 length:291 start_codon:yes stop_codon:yes gene_type:complete
MDMSLKKNNKEQKLPKWFDGEVYEIGDEVRNPFTGERYTLTAKELSMYDLIMGCQYLLEVRENQADFPGATLQKDMARGLSWFRVNNAKAYMVLLD